MAELEMVDASDQLSSIRDIHEAIHASGLLVIHILKLPPEAAVYVGVIHRCLKEYLVLRQAIEKKKP